MKKIYKAAGDNEYTALGERSKENIFTMENKQTFIILKDYFPTDWSPDCLKIGIASISHNDLNNYLEGTFMYENNKTVLTDWYKEIIITDFDPDKNIIFSILLKKSLKIKIAWWCE